MNFHQVHFELIEPAKDSEQQLVADTEYLAYLINFAPTSPISVPILLGSIPYIF